MPPDQREDDGKSLSFDSPPLSERMEILGAPVVSLALSADRPLAMLAVRLGDVSPDGSATRVSYGLLNLAHRDGHERPRPLVPGRRESVRVALNDAGHGFAPGHRIRVAISNVYWPVAWPSPEPVTLTIFAGECTLDLPIRPPRDADAQLRAFPDPEAAPPPDHVDLDEGHAERSLGRDLASGETIYRVSSDATREGAPAMYRLEAIGLEMGHSMEHELRIGETDPSSAQAEISHRVALRRGDWATRVETRSHLSSNATHFQLTATLEAFEGETRVFTRSWDRKVPRDCV
jgi:hypothetical protein